MASLCYRHHRFPPEVIQHAIWLYLRFTLSYAVEACVNAAQVNQHEFFGFVRLLWGMFVVSHGRGPHSIGPGT
jgi:hypothetical protein